MSHKVTNTENSLKVSGTTSRLCTPEEPFPLITGRTW